jgi:hypothetical protein
MQTFSHLWHLTELSLQWEMFQTRVVENIKIHILWSVTFPENRAVYEILSKNVMEPEGPKMTSQYGAYALHAG